MEAWLSARAGPARAGSWCRSAATSARSWSWRRATPSCRIARASTRSPPRTSTRSRRCARVLGLPSIPRRIECFDISTIQGSETVASMVVCEDGRMKKSEYRKFRIRGLPAQLAAPARQLEPDPGVRPRRLRRDARGRAAPLSQGARGRRAVSGPDPDRRRQGPAVGGLRGARGDRARATWWPSASPRRRSCSSRATGRSRSCCAENDPALLLIQRIRDEAHRFAVTFHRKARIDARPAVGARRRARHRPAPPSRAADDVRQPGRRPPRHARGARAPWSARRPRPRSSTTSRNRRDGLGASTRLGPGSSLGDLVRGYPPNMIRSKRLCVSVVREITRPKRMFDTKSCNPSVPAALTGNPTATACAAKSVRIRAFVLVLPTPNRQLRCWP